MNYFAEYIQKLQGLIKINSVEAQPIDDKPFGVGVNDALEYTLDLAKSLGFRTFNGEGYYGYAEIGEGEEMLGILGHLDTVPIGNDWSVPALEGAIIDGELCGRGVLDDKGPILATLYAVKELMDSGKTPHMRIRIIFGCNEESGWNCIDKYVEKEEIPTMAFTPDGDFPVINCEKGVAYYTVHISKPDYVVSIHGGDRPNMVMDHVELEVKDASLLNNLDNNLVEVDGNKIIARGISAHGSTPELGENALWKLLTVLSKYDASASKLLAIISNTDGSGYGIKCSDQVSGALTINVGKIDSTAREIVFSLDIRYPITVDSEKLYTTLCATFSKGKVEKGFFHKPLYIAPDHPLCKSLLDAYADVTGENLAPIQIGGATYARALPCAVAFGPIFPGQVSTIHQKNERAKLADLEKMYLIYIKAISNLAF